MCIADRVLNSMDSTCFESETKSTTSRCVVSMCHQVSIDLKHMSMTYYRWSPDAGLGFRNGCMDNQSLGIDLADIGLDLASLSTCNQQHSMICRASLEHKLLYNRTSDTMHTTCCRPNATCSVTELQSRADLNCEWVVENRHLCQLHEHINFSENRLS
jgi:hypothetical protein